MLASNSAQISSDGRELSLTLRKGVCLHSGRELLDAGFGNHPALLALTQNGKTIEDGPQLVVPGDRGPQRFVSDVSEVTVGIATALATNTTLRPAARSSSSTATTR